MWGEHPSWYVIAKYNSELELIYERYIGDSANYWLFNLTATSDSGVILSGTRYDYWEPITKKKAVITKLNSEGLIVGALKENTELRVRNAIVYPNPGISRLIVRTALKNCIIRLFDMKGKEEFRKPLDNIITEINTGMLKPGSYIYSIEQNKHTIENGIWIKQ